MNNREKHERAGQAICAAWRDKNYQILESVLADTLQWYEGSFDEPQITPDQVIARWEQDLRNQSNIRAEITAIEMVGDVSF